MKVATHNARQLLLLLGAMLIYIPTRAQFAHLVQDVNTAPASSSPTLVEVGGVAFFAATDPASGRELWKSDHGGRHGSGQGHRAGIRLFVSFTNVNGTLFFTAFDPVMGTELWKSDGTAAGTALVRDINPGPGGSDPEALTNVDGQLVFFASDGVNGFDLWKSDGTEQGTLLAQDIAPGIPSSFPQIFTISGALVFFTADDTFTGVELWSIPRARLSITSALQGLIGMVNDINARHGLTNSLASKAQNALDALTAHNANHRRGAQKKLQAFVNEVKAQSGKGLDTADADSLIALAQSIIVIL